MNFLKKIFGVFSKMTTSRKNEKLVEALNQKPKPKEDPVQDIEDLLKTQYSSPLQTRSQRMKKTKIEANSSLTAGTSANMKAIPIPLLKAKSLTNTNRNLNAKLKPREQRIVQDVIPEMSSVVEITTQSDTNQMDILGLETVSTEKTMLSEFCHPMNEIDNKFRQPFDSEYGKSVPLTLVPSSESSDVVNANTTIDAKKAKSVEPTHSSVNKSTQSTTRVADEKSPKAKSNRKTKPLMVSKEKVEAIKKKEPVSKKKSTKKDAKEKIETEMEEDKSSSYEHVVLENVFGQKNMPVSPKPSKKALKLSPFLFNPHKIDKDSKELKIEDSVVEIKEESKRKRASPLKEKALSDSEPDTKLEKWQPQKWTEALENIKQMRTSQEAPVDQMGCHKCCDENADEKTRRFQLLVALMLSSQTRDQITYEVMHRLRDNTCTPASIVQMEPERLMEILHPVSFYKNKTKYLQNTAKILVEKYDSDIPNNVKEMMKLPGVGPKMAHICMSVAWDLITGIGVDTHVHRISNRLGWVKTATKDPEQTRKQLELWLPPQHWRDVNYLLVGFGQTLCTPVRPKCQECLNNAFCPSANITQISTKEELEKEKQGES